MKKITLSTPLVWGEEKISELALRRPNAGDLRGVKLTAIQDMEVSTLLALLPRICLTPLGRNVLDTLDPADVVAIYGELADFFVALPAPSPKTP